MFIDLYGLPLNVLFQICNEWIPLISLGRLDSASCSSDQRGDFLQLLGTPEHVFSADCCISAKNMENYLNWVVLRKMKISKLHFTDFFSPRTSPTALFTATGQHIRLITSDSKNQTSFQHFSPYIEKSCLNLQMLVLKHSYFARWIYRTLITCQAAIHTLVLTDGVILDFDMNDEFYCPKMRTLSFDGHHFPPSFVSKILHACPHLQELRFTRQQSTASGYAQHPIDGLKFLASMARSYDHLRLLDVSDTLISDSGLHKIAEHCPHLTSFTAAQCTRLTNVGIISLTTRCPGIEELNISKNNNFTNQSLTAVASTYFATLTRLNIGSCLGITGNGISNLMQQCGKLKSLAINDNFHLIEMDLLNCVHSCKHVEELGVNRLHISDKVLNAIADNCPYLRCFSMVSETKFTASGFRKFLKNVASHLEVLEVSLHCSVVNDLCVMFMEDMYPNLRVARTSEPWLAWDNDDDDDMFWEERN